MFLVSILNAGKADVGMVQNAFLLKFQPQHLRLAVRDSNDFPINRKFIVRIFERQAFKVEIILL